MDKYWIWFSRIQKLNSIQKEKLLLKYGNPKNIWNASIENLKAEMQFDDVSIQEIINQKYRKNIDKYENYMKKYNIKMITILDKEYPEKLRNIYDKPITLFIKGNTKLLNTKSIAIVGARNCSDYGKKVAVNISYNLAKENICVISGMAKGIDKYSHVGALEAKGNTIAVIGNGLDYIYPYENKDIYERILQNDGLIVTEYIIGTRPEKLNFPARNRIISALSDGIIIVEAGEKSGSLITAEFGLEHGKEVFAVPGNIDNINSKGTNNLIKDGAYVLTDYKDVLNIF